MEKLKPEHVRTLLDQTITRLLEALERTKAPWMRSTISDPVPGMFPGHNGFKMFAPSDNSRQIAAKAARESIQKRGPSRWSRVASTQLESLGVRPDQESPIHNDFCVELSKLEMLYLDAEEARSKNGYLKEDEFIDYFKKNGYQLLPYALSKVGGSPRSS